MGDETGVAIAEAIEQNSTLQSFGMHVPDTKVGDDTAMAIAEAITINTALYSFSYTMALSEDIDAAMGETVKDAMARNRARHAMRRALASIARLDDSAAFGCWKNRHFRNMVFAYFGPHHGILQPLAPSPSLLPVPCFLFTQVQACSLVRVAFA